MNSRLDKFLEERVLDLFRVVLHFQIAVLAGFFAIYHFVMIPIGVLPAVVVMVVFFLVLHLLMLGRLRVFLNDIWKRQFPEFASMLKVYDR